MLMGGWLRFIWLVALGFAIILLVWTKGLFGRFSPQKGSSK
jgi:hypothetical protein